MVPVSLLPATQQKDAAPVAASPDPIFTGISTESIEIIRNREHHRIIRRVGREMSAFAGLSRSSSNRLRFEDFCRGVARQQQRLANGAVFLVHAIVAAPIGRDADAGRERERPLDHADHIGKRLMSLWRRGPACNARPACRVGCARFHASSVPAEFAREICAARSPPPRCPRSSSANRCPAWRARSANAARSALSGTAWKIGLKPECFYGVSHKSVKRVWERSRWPARRTRLP